MGTIGYFDYSACIYPLGQSDQQQFFFNKEDIDKVIFEGYRNDEDEEYCKVYEEMIENVQYPKLQLQFEEAAE